MDLIKMITDEVQDLETSGKMKEIVKKHVEKTVDEIVKESFGWRGEGQKAIETALKGKLGAALENVNLTQYNKIITTIVSKRLNNSVAKDLQAQIEKTVNETTGILEKKEWNLSEIIEKFIDGISKDYDSMDGNEYEEISFYKSGDGEYIHIYFDAEKGKREFECNNKIFIHENKLKSLTIDKQEYTPLSANHFNSFEAFMFNLYVNNVKITIDEVETEYAGDFVGY